MAKASYTKTTKRRIKKGSKSARKCNMCHGTGYIKSKK